MTMTTDRFREARVMLIPACLASIFTSSHGFWTFDGTEFGGGSLAQNNYTGGLLLVLAAILIFKFPKAASAIAIVACFLSVPLYLYLLYPRPFRKYWPGEWKSPVWPRESFVWDGWWAFGTLSVVLVALIATLILIRTLSTRKHIEIKA
jgi:hypothetical protein